MPRQLEAGLVIAYSISSVFKTSTIKSDPGFPLTVPGEPSAPASMKDPLSAATTCALGRNALGGGAVCPCGKIAALALSPAATAPAPAIATPCMNLRRSTAAESLLIASFFLAMVLHPDTFTGGLFVPPFRRDLISFGNQTSSENAAGPGRRAQIAVRFCLSGLAYRRRVEQTAIKP